MKFNELMYQGFGHSTELYEIGLKYQKVKTYHNKQAFGSDADTIIILIRNGVDE